MKWREMERKYGIGRRERRKIEWREKVEKGIREKIKKEEMEKKELLKSGDGPGQWPQQWHGNRHLTYTHVPTLTFFVKTFTRTNHQTVMH